MWKKKKQITGDLQFLKKLNEDRFKVVNTTYFTPQSIYCYSVYDIDLRKFTKEQLTLEIEEYYSSIQSLKDSNETNWKEVLAGIIAENMTDLQFEFDSEEELKVALLTNGF